MPKNRLIASALARAGLTPDREPFAAKSDANDRPPRQQSHRERTFAELEHAARVLAENEADAVRQKLRKAEVRVAFEQELAAAQRRNATRARLGPRKPLPLNITL